MRILVTGGAGFIGSNFIKLYLARHPDCEIVNLDKLTYAGNLENLRDVESDERYRFVRGDICDESVVATAMRGCDAVVNFAAETHVDRSMRGCDAVVNFAAETHVDRSIGDPAGFLKTDVFGVHVLLEAARAADVSRFIQISTDEVYGPTLDCAFTEEDRLNPRNPYSASKAGGELLARSYYETYDFPVIISRGANNRICHSPSTVTASRSAIIRT